MNSQLPLLPPYQARVIAEKEELDARLVKLLDFINKPTFPNVPAVERDLLAQQAGLMRNLSALLAARINLF